MGLLPCYVEIQKKTSCCYKKKGMKSKKKQSKPLNKKTGWLLQCVNLLLKGTVAFLRGMGSQFLLFSESLFLFITLLALPVMLSRNCNGDFLRVTVFWAPPSSFTVKALSGQRKQEKANTCSYVLIAEPFRRAKRWNQPRCSCSTCVQWNFIQPHRRMKL